MKEKTLKRTAKYTNQNTCYCFYISGSTLGFKSKFRSEWFGEGQLVPFEDVTFYVPKEYDKVLRTTYGEYMQMPPESAQVSKLENIVKVDFQKSYTEYKNILYGHNFGSEKDNSKS